MMHHNIPPIMSPQPLWQHLLDKGVISDDQLRLVLQEQRRTQQPISRLLVGLGFLSETLLRDLIAEHHAQHTVDLSKTTPSAEALALVPQDFARRHLVLPLYIDQTQHSLTLAQVDPNNLPSLDKLHTLLQGRYQLISLVASESELRWALERYYGETHTLDHILRELAPQIQLPTSQPTFNLNDNQAPIIRLVDAIFNTVVQEHASDIHFEPEASFLRIRYRVDGVLRPLRSIEKQLWPQLTVRLKVMSNLDIAETRAPQDGRMSLHIAGRQIDFRIATHPTTHGENIVLRILDKQKGIVPLDQLGLNPPELQQLHSLLQRPEGIILVTGPTGSGKTTTLYSMLNHLNTEAVNIMT